MLPQTEMPGLRSSPSMNVFREAGHPTRYCRSSIVVIESALTALTVLLQQLSGTTFCTNKWSAGDKKNTISRLLCFCWSFSTQTVLFCVGVSPNSRVVAQGAGGSPHLEPPLTANPNPEGLVWKTFTRYLSNDCAIMLQPSVPHLYVPARSSSGFCLNRALYYYYYYYCVKIGTYGSVLCSPDKTMIEGQWTASGTSIR